VLALSSGGVVRRYLLERGALPAKSMTAAGADLAARRGQYRRQQPGVRHDLLDRHQMSRIRRHGWRRSSRQSTKIQGNVASVAGADARRSPSISMLGTPILVQILRACCTAVSSLVRRVCRRRRLLRSPMCRGPRQTLYAGGPRNCCTSSRCRFRPTGLALKHHGAELSRPARFRLHRRGPHIIPHVQTALRHAAGRIRKRWRLPMRRRQSDAQSVAKLMIPLQRFLCPGRSAARSPCGVLRCRAGGRTGRRCSVRSRLCGAPAERSAAPRPGTRGTTGSVL